MTVIVYALYLAIALGITMWVAHTLSSVGVIFLIKCFGHDELLARSTNHLLVVGFYLVNIGFIALTLAASEEPVGLAESIRFLAAKVGVTVLVLGAMHFFNMHIIARFGRKVSEWFEQSGQARAALA